jgi:trafficking protein particle complex subunit 10
MCTVEYYDPSGVFPLISPQLLARLPLRNLHWKSPTRPLRSIDSLHIDFVPGHDSPTSSAEALQAPSDTGTPVSTHSKVGTQARQSNDVQSPSESSKGASRERRHQIPGLRQNPYLKIYFLRCDDNEAYKTSARKQIRDWMRIHTPSSQSSSANAQENHDAFECFIVHVVLPETPAASQPRWSGTSGSTSTTSVEKGGGSSRWPGRSSSTTLFEKIRADFNGSSKSAPDRVAQIRLSKEALSDHAQSTAARPYTPSGPETAQDWENAWNDLIAKMKTLILMSFDLRVSQYEEDIREKDSQRPLPGWNFCTFFLLKEGLARGFESVGLVEDALVGYDELSIGLDSIIREQAVEGHSGHGGVFPSHTEDLLEDLVAQSEGKSAKSGICEKPINSGRKNYRELILSNDISVFDFKCYIFSRQMTLLMRLGNPQSVRSELLSKLQSVKSPRGIQQSRDDLSLPSTPQPSNERLEDPGSLAELCGRAVSFITSTARDIRADLYLW